MKVVAAVVTHNRPQLLEEVLQALQNQTRPLDQIIVVDNASAPATAELLTAWPQVRVERLETNTGGAGGFASGIALAVSEHADWIFLLDDDAVPEHTALAMLLDGVPTLDERVGALCTRVIESGRIALQHRRYFNPVTLREPVVPRIAYCNGAIDVDTASFVGLLLRATAVQDIGLPERDFFLAYDDTEYTLRLRTNHWRIVLRPNSIVNHKRLPQNRLRLSQYGMRHYYHLRNQLIVMRRYGRASAWRLGFPIFKHALLALCTARLSAFRLLWHAILDSRTFKVNKSSNING
jgi:rhamnopyranosyl-N-acetylglucosaminyl-diphospho-decaprenol beta-1,3/1,4-galactofuranosyltransferase